MAFYDELLAATEVERNTLMCLPLITDGGTGNNVPFDNIIDVRGSVHAVL